MHVLRRPARIALAGSALLLAWTLTACSSDSGAATATPTASATAADTASPTPTATATPVPVSSSIDGITVAGDAGAAPTVSIPTPFAIDETRTRMLIDVDSDAPGAEADSVVEVNYVGVNARTGETFNSTWDKGSAGVLSLQQTVTGFTKGLTGAKPGQRILIVVPGSEGYDSAGGSSPSIEVGDTLVFVVDVIAVSVAQATGSSASPALPVTLGEADGAPVVTIPDGAAAPTELIASPVIVGAQREVGAEDYVLVHYRSWSWKSGEMIEDKWTTSVSGAIGEALEGFKLGIVGQRIGSRVVLVVPPEVGYAKASQNPEVEAGDTVVYVVDILFSTAVS